ncbi:MAG TPA: universal stress protein [Gemmatimonadaceae bacterium]|nr:universal stress protein [Gemmatimonadaceae bacterium]
MAVLMYKRILVCLENSGTDAHIVEHIGPLAKLCRASVLLIHVADGWAARNIKQLDLRESEEMREDREYLERVAAGFVAAGVPAEAILATGDPATEVTATAARERCDLIAMATHGHKLIGDVIHGSVANQVRHKSMVPVLLVRAPTKAAVT